jgi:2-methylfumaryl-CoA isomerase
LFDAAGLTWSVFRSFAEAVRDDPDLEPDNPMFAMLDQPGLGRYPVPGSPINWGDFARKAPAIAPALGQDT